jgi:hypothetical protein
MKKQSKLVESVWKGETWMAYRPGEDAQFPDAFTARSQSGFLHSVVNSEAMLIANAKLCQVKLKWFTKRKRILKPGKDK